VTADKDFKRVVRNYAREHGISYAAARRHLRPSTARRFEEHTMVEFNLAAPILRFFDEDKAREFYVDYLAMKVDFEHRFDPDSPLYMQVSRGKLVLHLSEHHGDGTPGTHVLVYTTGLAELQAELAGKDRIGRQLPGLEQDDIGTWVQVTDPFGNVLRFLESSSDP
jgi:ribosomal-protein-alanine N-acetyltransferase